MKKLLLPFIILLMTNIFIAQEQPSNAETVNNLKKQLIGKHYSYFIDSYIHLIDFEKEFGDGLGGKVYIWKNKQDEVVTLFCDADGIIYKLNYYKPPVPQINPGEDDAFGSACLYILLIVMMTWEF
jgi:hypothetical protein